MIHLVDSYETKGNPAGKWSRFDSFSLDSAGSGLYGMTRAAAKTAFGFQALITMPGLDGDKSMAKNSHRSGRKNPFNPPALVMKK